jgi:hypothetical protein
VFGWILARDFIRLERVLSKQANAAQRWHDAYPDGVPAPGAPDLYAGIDAGRPAPAE